MLSRKFIYLFIGFPLSFSPRVLGGPNESFCLSRSISAEERSRIIDWLMKLERFTSKHEETAEHMLRPDFSHLTFGLSLEEMQKIYEKYNILVLRPRAWEPYALFKFGLQEKELGEESASNAASDSSSFIINSDITTNPHIAADGSHEGLGRFIQDQGIKFRAVECQWPPHPLPDQFYDNVYAMLPNGGVLSNRGEKNFHFQIPSIVLFPPYQYKEALLEVLPLPATALEAYPEGQPFMIKDVEPVPFCGVYLSLENYVSITFLTTILDSLKALTHEEDQLLSANEMIRRMHKSLGFTLDLSLQNQIENPSVSIFDAFREKINHNMSNLKDFIKKLPEEDKRKAYHVMHLLLEEFKLSKRLVFLQEAQESDPDQNHFALKLTKQLEKLLESVHEAFYSYGKKLVIEENEQGCSAPVLSQSIKMIREFYQEKGFLFRSREAKIDLDTLNVDTGFFSYHPFAELRRGLTTISYNISPIDLPENPPGTLFRFASEGPQFLIKMTKPEASSSEPCQKKAFPSPQEAD